MDTEILAVLDEHEQLSVVEIADVMGAHPVVVDRRCYQLQQTGYVRIFSGGFYSLSDDGEDYLSQRQSEHSR